MPPSPSFDYYAELQVESSASSTEITAAYRRLARIHHPDKNPDRQEEATAIFQRLQLAHETLSDPVKREQYDNGDDLLFDSDPFESDSFPFPVPFEFFFFFSTRASQPFSPPPDARPPPRRDLRAQFQAAEKLRRENEAKIKREQQRQRQEAEEAREKRKALARRLLQDEELKKQEKRWEEMGAVSKDEKLSTCLHSDLCDKVQHNKKFKCTTCSAKRGMTAFECPHCFASLCQLCVTTFSERRKKLKMKEQMGGSDTPKNSAGMDDKSTSNEPNVKEPIVKEPIVKEPIVKEPIVKEPIVKEPSANNPSASNPSTVKPNAAKQNASKSNAKESTAGSPASKKSKNKKPKNDRPSQQTSTSGKSGNNHKDKRERNPGASEGNEDEAAPTSEARFASDNPYDILMRDDQTTDPTGPVLNPTAGPTGGYIRSLGGMPMPPTAVLRQAMEQFGAVKSLKITNKRPGIAHVNFAAHDGLSSAMAASPVSVSATVNVSVVELKHCRTCGKAGHVAETCRAAQGKA